MSWRTDVIEAMPIGVELTAPMITDILRPNAKPWERRSIISRVFKALQTEEQYSSVVRVGERNIGNRKVIVWKRVF